MGSRAWPKETLVAEFPMHHQAQLPPSFRVSPSSWFIQEAKISMCVFGQQGCLTRSVPLWFGVILNTRRCVWSPLLWFLNTRCPLWRPYHLQNQLSKAGHRRHAWTRSRLQRRIGGITLCWYCTSQLISAVLSHAMLALASSCAS